MEIGTGTAEEETRVTRREAAAENKLLHSADAAGYSIHRLQGEARALILLHFFPRLAIALRVDSWMT